MILFFKFNGAIFIFPAIIFGSLCSICVFFKLNPSEVITKTLKMIASYERQMYQYYLR